MFQQNQPTIKNQVLTWSRDLTKWHDPAKTTCRDNPRGGGSPALMRATSMCSAMEARALRHGAGMLSGKKHEEALAFAMSIAQEMKQRNG